MNIDTANKLLDLINESSKCLDESVAVAKSECSDVDFRSYRSAIAQIMGALVVNVKEPIYKKFPELDPGYEDTQH